MDITFKMSKLRKTFNSEKELKKVYGNENSKKIKNRMAVLSAAINLSEVPGDKPERCHALKGDRLGQFALDLKHPKRMVFCPDHEAAPKGCSFANGFRCMNTSVFRLQIRNLNTAFVPI